MASTEEIGAATSKKFLANVEPILLAPPTKPLVNQNTYRIIADIVGDLTFHYSHERGCEGLVELWKKIKLRSDDDGVSFANILWLSVYLES